MFGRELIPHHIIRSRSSGVLSVSALIAVVFVCTPAIGWGQDLSIDEIVRLVRAQDDAIDDETADVEIR